MKAERRKQIEELYLSAREREGPEREQFLETACGGDEALRREVESLLGHGANAQDFMQAPAVEAMARDQERSLVGKQIGSYTVLSLRGRGGMGEVYLARDQTLESKVALKFLPQGMEADPVARKRLLREAKAAAALNHSFICRTHQIGEFDGNVFIAMEYVEGEGLDERLVKGPFPLKEALEKGREIAEALEAAHKQNIVHRDLKPSNIMLTADGHVKVMDFGLAKRLAAAEGMESQSQVVTTERLSKSGMILGTLPYMSPEQVRGVEVDTRSDIFSFGIVLFEMLSGIHPFKKPESMEMASAILTDDPPLLSQYLNAVPPVLEHIVKKMLAKELDRRYQVIHDVATDLGEVMGDHSGSASVPTTLQPEDRPSWQKMVPWAISGLVTVALLIALLVQSLIPQVEQTAVRPLPFFGPEGPIGLHESARSGDNAWWSESSNGRVVP